MWEEATMKTLTGQSYSFTSQPSITVLRFLCAIDHFFRDQFIYFHLCIFICICWVNVWDSITVDQWSVVWTTWSSWSVQMHARMHTQDEEFCLSLWAADCPTHLYNHAIFSPLLSNRCTSLLFTLKSVPHKHAHTCAHAYTNTYCRPLYVLKQYFSHTHTHEVYTYRTCTSQSEILTWYMDRCIWPFTVYIARHRSM